MLIAGLDLAAEPKGTALAVLEWSQNRVNLLSLAVGVDDETVVEAAPNFDKLGIDCALGWPIEFTNFLRVYSRANISGQTFDGDIDWRRTLAYRETDREVRRLAGRWPSSGS
jgi:predicted nuclease with RNAse H fold